MISIENVQVIFGQKKVLENFSLTINKGDKILIQGKSGSGKSTLLKLLMGFEKVEKGDILFEGASIFDPKTDYFALRKNFAYVNQEVTMRRGRVKEVLAEIASFEGNDLASSLDRKLMEIFDFSEELLEKKVTALSGGERQRLGLMVAIMLNRPIFLLDEITSALDEDLKNKVVAYFEQSKKTVIVISHDHHWQEKDIFRKVVW